MQTVGTAYVESIMLLLFAETVTHFVPWIEITDLGECLMCFEPLTMHCLPRRHHSCLLLDGLINLYTRTSQPNSDLNIIKRSTRPACDVENHFPS